MRKDGEGVLVKGVEQLSYHRRTDGSQEVVPIVTPMGQLIHWERTEAWAVRKTELLREK